MKAVSLNLVPTLAPDSSPLVDPESQQRVCAQVVAGEHGWQRAAFDEFSGLVHGLVIKSLGPRCDVEDLVGDIFLSFFEYAHRIRTAGAVRSYLVSITMNVVRREVRRRRRRALFYRPNSSQEDLEREPAGDDPKAKVALIRLSRILDTLTADERAVFVLRNLEGMKVADIATTLGMSQSTAKRRAARATDKVMKLVRRNALLSDYIREKCGGADV